MKKRSERKAAAAGRRPPLDSPNWIPIKNAFSGVYQRTGNLQLAAKDLTELLAARRNRVRSMRRSLEHGQESERELLSTKFWHEMYCTPCQTTCHTACLSFQSRSS